MDEREPLTKDGEVRVYALLRERMRNGGRAPSNEEGAHAMGWDSTRAWTYWLDRLVEKGYIRRGKGHRNIELIDSPDAVLVYGAVACGSPIPAGEGSPEPIDLNAVFNAPDILMLRAKGDSMKGAGVLDGDLIAVRKSPDALPGEMVVCSIDGDVTLKVYSPSTDGTIWLHPCNPRSRRIRLDPSNRNIIVGVFAGVVRLPK